MVSKFYEQRVNIKFCLKLGKSFTMAYNLLKEVYGDSTMSRSQAFEWYKRFEVGREDPNDDERLGRRKKNPGDKSSPKKKKSAAKDGEKKKRTRAAKTAKQIEKELPVPVIQNNCMIELQQQQQQAPPVLMNNKYDQVQQINPKFPPAPRPWY